MNKIKELRMNKGMKQIDLAKEVGITKSYLSEIENDKKNGSIEVINKIAAVLGVGVETLISSGTSKSEYTCTKSNWCK